MDSLAGQKGVAASLSQLRTNALLAFRTSGGRAVSKTDIDRLEAIITRAFGAAPSEFEYTPLGSIPKPDGPILKALTERLPAMDAEKAHAFLVDLHHRTHDWFTV
jgi:hypothetical protein